MRFLALVGFSSLQLSIRTIQANINTRLQTHVLHDIINIYSFLLLHCIWGNDGSERNTCMYHVECINIHKTDQMYLYIDRVCLCANNMYNVANFHIRNLMTGLKKDVSLRTENEKSVIRTFSDSIPRINFSLRMKRFAKIWRITLDRSLSEDRRAARISKLKYVPFTMPTAVKWFASYELLDAVFRHVKNTDYRAFHSHVVQNAISDCCEAWEGYFEKLKRYSAGSGHTGKPRIPGYRKPGGRSTAVFSNLACRVRNGKLYFPNASDGAGKKMARPILAVAGLPHASKEKLIEVRAVPYFDVYQIQILTDDGLGEEDLLPEEKDIIGADGEPAGVMMLDPGLDNFAAMTDNKGNTPIVVKGGAIKACNQWFNKRMSFLRSEQMKGHDPKTFHPPVTKQMKRISRKRDAFLRDTFYKYAHYIFRLMKERGLSFLIIGYNKGQKQEISLGRRNNQAFVQVPFARFRRILQTISVKYGIRVICQEESYTSMACFGMGDPVPAYGKDDAGKVQFSGKRIFRGLYRQDDGKVLNADINGAANIGRKHDRRIFPERMEYGYLYDTVISLTYKDILRISQSRNRSNPGNTGQRARVCPVTA